MPRLLREKTLHHMTSELHAGVSVAFLAASCLCCFFSWLVLMGELVEFVVEFSFLILHCISSFTLEPFELHVYSG